MKNNQRGRNFFSKKLDLFWVIGIFGQQKKKRDIEKKFFLKGEPDVNIFYQLNFI